MVHQPDSTVHCRTTPSNTALPMKGDSSLTWRLSDIQYTRVHHVMTSLGHTSLGAYEGWSSKPDYARAHRVPFLSTMGFY